MKIRKAMMGLLAASLFVISACAGSDNTASPSTSASTAPSATAPEATPEATDNADATGWPIVKDKITIKFMTGKYPTNMSDYNQVAVWKKYEEMTNIHIDWGLVEKSALSEKRNLSLASGDYPDVFYTADVPVTDLTKYAQQGTFIQLDQLIEDHMPNLKKLFEEYPDIKKGLALTDGHIYSLPTIYSFDAVQMSGAGWIREDWLKQLNMAMPETTEQFYEYLKAVKTTDLNGNGKTDEIPYGGKNMSSIIDFVKGSYGLGNRGYHHKYVDADPNTKELRFFPIDDKYKEMVEYVHKLYAEGLIEQNIYSIDVNQYNATGAADLYGSTVVKAPEVQFGSKNFQVIPVLKGPDGTQLFSMKGTPLVRINGFVVTDKNPDPVATVKWLDYFYSDEGTKMFFMGVEGESYEVKADGSVDYLDKHRNNPEGLSLEQSIAPFVTYMGGGYPGIVKKEFFKGAETLPAYLEAAEMYKPYFPEVSWPQFVYTPDESKKMSALAGDIEKYVTEMTDKFIVGQAPLSQWDQYVSQIRKMGLDRYMELYQAAYDRYNNNK